MFCENCGNKIKENEKFCTNCGTEVNSNSSVITKLLKTKKGLAITLFAVALLLILGLSVFVFAMPQAANITTYKSIVPIEQVKMKNMQNREILDLLIQQDKDLTEYVNKKPKANIDGLFETFYRNLLTFTGDIADVNEKFTYSGFGEQNQAKDGIEFSFTMDKKFPDYVETVKLVKPKTDLFTMAHTQDANFEAKINYNYLINRYSANLSPALQRFLNIRQNEVSKLNGPYYGEGWSPAPNLLTEFYLDEQQLLNKYPNFILKDIVQNTLKIHTTELLSPDINLLFDTDKNDYTKYTKLNNEVKTGYEKFLKEADKSTKEYKFINDLYETLKKDNFNYSSNLNNILFKLTGNEKYNVVETVEDNSNKVHKSHDFEYMGFKRYNADDSLEPQYDTDEMKQVYELAYRIKKIVEKEDIVEFSKLIQYPMTLDYDGTSHTFNNEQEFQQIDKQILFNQKMRKAVQNNEIFDNWQGFMLGNGEIWIYPNKNGAAKIDGINIIE